MLSICFTIVSLVFCLILVIVFFGRDRIDSVENRVYSYIVLSTFFSGLMEIVTFGQVQSGISANDPNYHLTMKLLFTGFLSWTYFFTLYTVITGRKLRGIFEKNSIPIKRLSVYFIMLSIGILMLPVSINEVNGLLLPVGLSVNLIYLVVGICVITMIMSLIKNRKNLKSKKYIPLYMVIVLFVVVVVLQKVFPELFLVNTVFSVISFCMYFTIENPDIKLAEELIENRRIIERTNEEKSVFLFKITQGLREPVYNIEKELGFIKNEKMTKKDIMESLSIIEKNNQKINFLINEVLGINSLDNTNMKKIENTYNIYSLLEDIKKRGQAQVNSKIDYRYTIVDNMPKELYGDSIKLKQVLMSVLINALKHTKEGFVHVDVNSFTKYDICRVIITIADSGKGINIVDINDILEQDLEFNEQDYMKLEKLDVDLPLAYKIIKMLGGAMHIKSEPQKGTEITITLDQYIVMNEDIRNNSKVDVFLKERTNAKRILVVNDNEDEIRRIKRVLEKKDYDVVTSMFGQDAIARIRNKEKYDVILIDDEMPLMNGINVLDELVKLKNKSKKIVLLEKDKLFIAHHYVKDGFNNYIDKTHLVKELDEKIK